MNGLNNIFCAHGGISPKLTKIEEINYYYRFVDLEDIMDTYNFVDSAYYQKKSTKDDDVKKKLIQMIQTIII
eukprot:UN08217